MDKSSMDSKFYAILVCQFIVMRYFFKKLKDLKEREIYIYMYVMFTLYLRWIDEKFASLRLSVTVGIRLIRIV